MSDTVYTDAQGDQNGNDPNNWTDGVPAVGKTMVVDGSVTDDDCTFSGDISCDACRTDSAYSGTVTVNDFHTLTLAGLAAINFPLVIGSGAYGYYLRCADLQCGAQADISGTGYLQVTITAVGEGVSTFASGARIRCASLRLNCSAAAGAVFAAGTYETDVIIYVGTYTRTLTLSVGTYTLNGLELTTNFGGDLTLDLATNNPVGTVAGNLTIDIDSSGDVILDASSQPWTITGSIVYQHDGSGTFTADSQDIRLGGTGDQNVSGCGGTWGTVTVSKSAGTVTLTDTLTCGAFGGVTGTLDLDGQTLAVSGAVTLLSGFTLADPAGSTITCDTFAADGQDLDASGAWTLTAATSGTLHNLTVANCDASGGAEIDATDNCVDGGGNSNIDFGVNRRRRLLICGAAR